MYKNNKKRCLMEIWQAIVLGVVQGISEFLPISSSGHLAVLQVVFGMSLHGITFDIFLHVGSLVAVFVVFWKDIWNLIRNPFQKITAMLIIGTIPAVILGFLLRSHMDGLQHGVFLAIAFTFTGAMLIFADGITGSIKTEKEMTYIDALMVGLMQALAIPPGVSRSGSTITGALMRGLDRETAARFSFLLSIIAILGAGALEAIDVIREPETISYIPAYIVGFVAAAVSGYFSIRLLLKLIKKAQLKHFSYYLFVLAAFILLDRFVLNLFFVR